MKKKILATLLAVAMVASLVTGCGGTKEAAQESAAEEIAEEVAEEVAEEKGDEEYDYVVGFANIHEAAADAIQLGDCIEEECAKLGMKVIRVNNDLDGAKAVKNVDDLLTMGIDALIEFNVDQSVAPAIMEKCDEADVPVFAIDIEHPGATFFGADNHRAGELAGEYLAQMALEKWDGEVDGLLLIDQMVSGELPRKRILDSVDPIMEAIPGFTEEDVYIVEGGSDAATAQQVVSDFLSAHPDWDHILAVPLVNEHVVGTRAALETAGREEHMMLVTQGEQVFFEHIDGYPEEDFVVGGVTFDLVKYGIWLAPLVRETLDSGVQPESGHVEHQIVTRANVNELYPER